MWNVIPDWEQGRHTMSLECVCLPWLSFCPEHGFALVHRSKSGNGEESESWKIGVRRHGNVARA